MYYDNNIENDMKVNKVKEKKKTKEKDISGRDMLALTIAAYQVLLPFVGMMVLCYGIVVLLFKILIS